MSQPRNMTTSPWDAQEFSQHGCFVQLVGGPANGEVVKFDKGMRELVVLVNDPKPVFNQTAAQKLFGKQPSKEYYRIELLSFREFQFAIGIWSKLPMMDAMLRVLEDARVLREQSKKRKQTAQSISIEADLTEINKGLLNFQQTIEKEMLSALNAITEPKPKAPKQDTTDPKQDTGDGTFSTSA